MVNCNKFLLKKIHKKLYDSYKLYYNLFFNNKYNHIYILYIYTKRIMKRK